MPLDTDRRASVEALTDQAVPIPIQIFLWKQVSPFVKPKLGKLHEASCMFCQHAPGHHELKEACKLFEKVLVQNITIGLKPDLTAALKHLPRWRLIQASLPHVMHSIASVLYNRMKDGNIQILGAMESKLLYTLHWILLDAAEECADADYERGIFHSSPFYYLFSIPSMTLFVYLFAPICQSLKESDFQNFRLENGLKIWQAMWEFRHPDAPCFTTHCKPKPKTLSGKSMKKNQYGDVFYGNDLCPEETLATVINKGIDLIVVEMTTADKDVAGILTKRINDRRIIFTWRNDGNVKINKSKFKMLPWKSNLQRNNVYASLFHCPPFNYINSSNLVYDGIEFNILKEITKLLPIKFVTNKIDESISMHKVVRTDVLSGRSNIGLCSQWLVNIDTDLFDFTTPYAYTCITFLVPKPLFLSYSTFIFEPLDGCLWLAISLVIIVLSSIIFVFGYIYQDMGIGLKIDYFEAFLALLGILTLRNAANHPILLRVSYRILVYSWCLYAVLITTAYSAGYTSTLSSPRFFHPIYTVKRNISWEGGCGGIGTNYMFKESIGFFRELFSTFLVEHSLRERGIRLHKRNYATLVQKLSDNYITDTENLDAFSKYNLNVLRECVAVYGSSFVLEKHSPYREVINRQISRLQGYGFISYWFSAMISKYNLKYINQFFLKNRNEKTIVSLDCG